MEIWIKIWTVVFVVVLSAFAGMSVWVTIGGFQDLKQMFRDLGDESKREDDSGESS